MLFLASFLEKILYLLTALLIIFFVCIYFDFLPQNLAFNLAHSSFFQSTTALFQDNELMKKEESLIEERILNRLEKEVGEFSHLMGEVFAKENLSFESLEHFIGSSVFFDNLFVFDKDYLVYQYKKNFSSLSREDIYQSSWIQIRNELYYAYIQDDKVILFLFNSDVIRRFLARHSFIPMIWDIKGLYIFSPVISKRTINSFIKAKDVLYRLDVSFQKEVLLGENLNIRYWVLVPSGTKGQNFYTLGLIIALLALWLGLLFKYSFVIRRYKERIKIKKMSNEDINKMPNLAEQEMEWIRKYIDSSK